jgi:hypothetical protein
MYFCFNTWWNVRGAASSLATSSTISSATAASATVSVVAAVLSVVVCYVASAACSCAFKPLKLENANNPAIDNKAITFFMII